MGWALAIIVAGCVGDDPSSAGAGDSGTRGSTSDASGGTTTSGAGTRGSAGDRGSDGEACDFINACDPGLSCEEAATPGCATQSCCTPFCDLNEPNTCPGLGQVCVPAFDTTTPPATLEHVGLCLLP